MARRLILDTGVLIAAERAKENIIFQSDDDICIAAITVAELYLGVDLADERYRSTRQAFVNSVLDVLPVEDYTTEIARVHAHLLAHIRKIGKPRSPHDMIIAATAVAAGRTIVSLDAKAKFGDIPDLDAITPNQ